MVHDIQSILFAGAIVAAVLAAVWTFDDLKPRFLDTLEDDGNEGADWGGEANHEGGQ